MNERLVELDALRGVAIVTMVLDHALVVFDVHGPPLVLRYTVTRVALPLFCLLAGALLDKQPRWERLAFVGAMGCYATIVGGPIGIGQPDILLLLALALVIGPWCSRNGHRLGAVLAPAVIQPVTWPIPWTGYQPGTVLALVLVGRVVGPHRYDGLAVLWPFRRTFGLAWIGRYPLTLYVGHLTVLYAIAR